jgi:S1-C subfamily serine protease
VTPQEESMPETVEIVGVQPEDEFDRTESEIPPPRRRARWPYALMALVIFVGGLGVGWLAWDQPAENGGVITILAPPAAQDAPGSEVATLQPGVEPVADVADALLPAMVKIESGGVGSGVIYDSDGLILTAAHVVQGSPQVVVRLADGDRVAGRVLGIAAGSDIAVVQIDRTDLPAAPLALDDPPRVGQLAVAIGSPWGLEQTVTAGIVSGVNRGGRGLIQTDAPINPGNSGGALADRLARVIGINIEIFTTTGANSGVGFAVPIQEAVAVAEKIVAGEPVEVAFLGVMGGDTELGRAGAVIIDVTSGSAADEAGLEAGDLVVAVNDRPITSMFELSSAIRASTPGDTITLEVVRDDETIELTATLRIRPPE